MELKKELSLALIAIVLFLLLTVAATAQDKRNDMVPPSHGLSIRTIWLWPVCS